MKMMKKLVKVQLRKNSLINQEPRMVQSLIYCKQFPSIPDEMWFLTAGPVVNIPMILTGFPQGKELREFLQEAQL